MRPYGVEQDGPDLKCRTEIYYYATFSCEKMPLAVVSFEWSDLDQARSSADGPRIFLTARPIVYIQACLDGKFFHPLFVTLNLWTHVQSIKYR